jgi:hypothetical protein
MLIVLEIIGAAVLAACAFVGLREILKRLIRADEEDK